jgi:outer membrane lipoprotein SlyB
MMRVSLLAAVVVTLAIEGCATTADSASKEPYTEREYRTGSNIAAKRTPYNADGVETMSRDEIERLGERNMGSGPMIPPGTR